MLTGTCSGREGPGVEGTLEITEQRGTTATAALAVGLLDHGNTFFGLNMPSDVVAATAAPGRAELRREGTKALVSLVFSGREEISGIDPASGCAYTLSLTGVLFPDAIYGRWVLTTDLPSSDHGTFTAAR